jgi:hypothetical protein
MIYYIGVRMLLHNKYQKRYINFIGNSTMKRLILSALTITTSLFFACSEKGSPNNVSSNDHSVATVRIAVNDPSVTKVSAMVTATDMDTIKKDLPIVNDTAKGIIEGILIGNSRKFEVSAFRNNIQTHYGVATEDIVANDTVQVPMTITPLFGRADFTIAVPANFSTPIDSITAQVISGTDTLKTLLTVGTSYTGAIEDIPVGAGATFKMFLYSDEVVKYSGTTTADVESGKPIDVSITLNPFTGSAELVATVNKGWNGNVEGELIADEKYNLVYSNTFNDLQGLTLFGDPLPILSSNASDGTGSALDNNGDPNYSSGAVLNNYTFDYTNGGRIEADFFVTSADDGCWLSSSVSLTSDTTVYSSTQSPPRVALWFGISYSGETPPIEDKKGG